MEKAYNPKNVESKIYKTWEDSGFFNPDNLPQDDKKESYVILMPLPNVTGSLHIGHVLDHTIQDLLIRWHRMRGYNALWMPGTDHAGIATQNVVEKQLRKEKTSRFELGREKFVDRVWEWKKEYGGTIDKQMRLLGNSCDWSRYRFTMDPDYSKAVTDTFVHYYNKGLIYKGQRVINWCPRCGTSLSDLETEHKETSTKLTYIRYPLVNDGNRHIVVATTRPETMLGDAAVAVNPKDERYKNMIGETAILPIVKRQISIIADEEIDKEFGSGAVKVTPSHDMLDAEIARRHNLKHYDIIDARGKMTDVSGEQFEGLKTKDAREKVLEELKELDLIEKEEDYTHNLAICYRCSSALEPQRSPQWFLKMSELAIAALSSVEEGRVFIFPNNFEKSYKNWLKNIRDWCISRQLWWGHRLPVYFCTNTSEKNEFVVSKDRPASCVFCKNCEMKQSPDVLDTWFSSALWPFAAMNKQDVEKYYPSNVLVTARDIINLWVGRMVFSGLEFIGQEPFEHVLIHGTILTKDGRRMSKSLGTGVDPVKIIEQHGADALRFAIIWQSMGQQDIRWQEDAVIAGKKFANKLWNASRFVIMRLPDKKITEDDLVKVLIDFTEKDSGAKQYLKDFETMALAMEKEVEQYRLGHALHTFYDFFWHKFCDHCLEDFKEKNNESASIFLLALFIHQLKLLHPFMPFITEHIYSLLPVEDKKLLMIEQV